MKKLLLSLCGLVATLGTSADEWQKPVYSGSYQALALDEVCYIYNPDAKLFLTEGNDYGTHASVGDTGLQFKVSAYIPEEQDWDGQTYTIQAYSIKNSSWSEVFINDYNGENPDGKNIYVDRRTQEDYLFQFISKGSDIYQITAANANPNFNPTLYPTSLVGWDENYINQQDGSSTGTGVIFEDPEVNTVLKTNWAFVSVENYDAYMAEIKRYEAALKLGEILTEAKELGVPDLSDEQNTYANTASDIDALTSAYESVNKKMLKYYEEIITPETPMTIDNDPCNSIESWTNGINATTWNTQTWIDDSWSGFEGTTLNIWGSEMNGKVYKSLADLPNGIYEVSIAVFAQDITGYVYANENQATVTGGAPGKAYKVTVEVTDGTLEYGFKQDETGTAWVAIDNAQVNYFGVGIEAYRYWINSLLADAPDFDTATAQTSMVEEYNNVLASVNTATTKEAILAIIPTYTAILEKINANIEAYDKLKATMDAADDMTYAEGINIYYSDRMSSGSELYDRLDGIVENHTLGTEEVLAAAAELQAVLDETQNFIWKWQDLTYEDPEDATKNGRLAKAAALYEEKKNECSLEAATAYEEFVEKWEKLNFDKQTLASALALIDEIDLIMFNLGVPATPASDDNPVDYTTKIQYPSFDSGRTGWINDGWSTCGANTWNSFANEYVIDVDYLNLWNTTNARVYQTITNLPEGTYMMQISAFANAEGLEVYANNDFLKVVVGENADSNPRVYDGSEEAKIYTVETTVVDPDSGEDTEDVVTPTTSHGNIYQIITTVGEDGTMEIGARNTSGGEMWGMIDNVKLTYYGANSEKVPTDIQSVADSAASQAAVTGIYSITGTQLPALQKGINLIKLSDGSVKKVLVK